MTAATEIYSLNEQGKRRNNQDRIFPRKGIATSNDHLFIVCDGVGGENKGEVASEIVCNSVNHYLSNHQLPAGNEKSVIDQAINYANRKLAEYARDDQSARRMSTTLSMVFFSEQSIIAAWCGDTRIHHIREGKVIWKSSDHSLVNELVKSGEISELEARSHPKRNIITRSLNALNTNNTVDYHEITNHQDGDYILLCTDGFLEQIDESIIYSILQEQDEADKASLFLSICEGNTNDNFSMYLMKVGDQEKLPSTAMSRYRLFFTSLVVFLCLASIVLMFVLIRRNESGNQKNFHQKGIVNDK